MLGLIIGLLPIALGIKAFTRDGLSVTRSKNIRGRGAKTIGVICIFVAWRSLPMEPLPRGTSSPRCQGTSPARSRRGCSRSIDSARNVGQS
jgi:hypothetical protein